MRFTLENGGRTGVRSAEDLGGMLDTWTPKQGALRIDFSPGYDQPGEIFRTVEELDKLKNAPCPADFVIQRGLLAIDPTALALGAELWAAGEALEISRATSLAARSCPRPSSL